MTHHEDRTFECFTSLSPVSVSTLSLLSLKNVDQYGNFVIHFYFCPCLYRKQFLLFFYGVLCHNLVLEPLVSVISFFHHEKYVYGGGS